MDEHAIPELNRDELRKFGLVTGSIVAGLFGLLIPLLFGRSLPWWPWVIFGILGGWALAAPASLRGFYRLWMRFGLLMSKVMTPLILGIFFFVVITPVAMLMKIFGNDPMSRRLDDAQSYRIESKKAPRENLEKPY